MEDTLLIVGLGNPGTKYTTTRHNMGFIVLDELANKLGITFSKKSDLEGLFAKGSVFGKKVYLLKPETYMNLSGKSVQKCMQFFKLTSEQILVVCDDIYLPFGELRYRKKGSAGGHNGLKDIEHHLGSNEYPRLKIGIGEGDCFDLTDHVLGNFKEEEKKLLPEIANKSADWVMQWIQEKNSGE